MKIVGSLWLTVLILNTHFLHIYNSSLTDLTKQPERELHRSRHKHHHHKKHHNRRNKVQMYNNGMMGMQSNYANMYGNPNQMVPFGQRKMMGGLLGGLGSMASGVMGGAGDMVGKTLGGVGDLLGGTGAPQQQGGGGGGGGQQAAPAAQNQQVEPEEEEGGIVGGANAVGETLGLGKGAGKGLMVGGAAAGAGYMMMQRRKKIHKAKVRMLDQKIAMKDFQSNLVDQEYQLLVHANRDLHAANGRISNLERNAVYRINARILDYAIGAYY